MSDKAKIISEYMASLGNKGGPASMKKLTAKQRIEKARKAATARWGKRQCSKADEIEKMAEAEQDPKTAAQLRKLANDLRAAFGTRAKIVREKKKP